MVSAVFRILCLLGLAAWSVSHATAAPPRGTYADHAGGRHRWFVNANHALVWNGDVWAPAGGVFVARSWRPDSTNADFASDLDALATLGRAGIRDLFVQPSGNGISAVPVARLQALVDALEGGGFRYGIGLADRTLGPTVVRQVLPSRHQVAKIGLGQTARIGVDHLESARYLVALPSGEVVDEGEVSVVEGNAFVPSRAPVEGGTAVVFPLRKIPADDAPFPAVWSGFDRWRDRIVSILAQVRFGPGLRFLADPLPPGIALDGVASSLIPAGPEAEAEWALFLESRYRTLGEWASAWRINRPDVVDSFGKAAAWIPLWFDNRGVPALLHPESGERLPVDSASSAYWTDLAEFKKSLFRRCADQMAMALKRGVADVPVVVRCRGKVPWGLDPGGSDSIDAVALMPMTGKPVEWESGMVERLGEAGHLPRPRWFLTAGLRETPGRAALGFASLDSLNQSAGRLLEGGDRGLFVDSLHALDESSELVGVPDQLAWVAEVGRRSLARGVATLPSPVARCIPFPAGLMVQPLALDGGGWWLPVDRTFRSYDFGPLGRAYGMAEGDGNTFVLWSDREREVKFRIPKILDTSKLAWWPAERGVRTKDMLVLRLGVDPVRLSGFEDTLPMPVDAFETAMAEATGALRELRGRRETEASRMELELSSLRTRYRADNTQSAFTLLQTVLDATRQIENVLRPYRYLWLEAEGGGDIRATHSFDNAQEVRGASGAKVLRVRAESLRHGPATASFRVNVNTAQNYRLFVSADSGARFQVRVDGRTVFTQAGPRVGREYSAAGLVWRDQGDVRFERGDHLVEIVAEGPMDLDALMLSASGSRPDGSAQPSVRAVVSKP